MKTSADLYSKQAVAALRQDATAADYEWRAQSREPDFYNFFLAALPAAPRRALDLGCGAGRLTVLLSDRVGHVVGLDLSPTLLLLAQERQARRDKKNVQWVQGDMHKPPFADDAFDFIASSNALRLGDLAQVLPRINRMLAPGGRLVVHDLVKSSLVPRARFLPHLYATLKNMPLMTATFGPGVALSIFKSRVSRSGRQTMNLERELSADQVRELYACTFSGCEIDLQLPRIKVLWDKPVDNLR